MLEELPQNRAVAIRHSLHAVNFAVHFELIRPLQRRRDLRTEYRRRAVVELRRHNQRRQAAANGLEGRPICKAFLPQRAIRHPVE